MAPTDLQPYELVLEISHGISSLETSVDELLADARALNGELLAHLSTVAAQRMNISSRTGERTP
ncbi:hypothetical protein ACQR1W_20015 [Bradyrhizobium sp. HKCCYLS1011]|uniref:hypothetical protein n=1 Tax=Bradyrhizobium sp. HKCCYLS1011 TaxID=3420733 RepID=UPI003EC0C1EA